jgi:hypothetical protein
MSGVRTYKLPISALRLHVYAVCGNGRFAGGGTANVLLAPTDRHHACMQSSTARMASDPTTAWIGSPTILFQTPKIVQLRIWHRRRSTLDAADDFRQYFWSGNDGPSIMSGPLALKPLLFHWVNAVTFESDLLKCIQSLLCHRHLTILHKVTKIRWLLFDVWQTPN